MNTYEIRIGREGIKSPDIYSSSHFSDYAAVRHAKKLATNDDLIEVWRGAICVYSGLRDEMPRISMGFGQYGPVRTSR
jgi:hypothetical protein